MRLTGFRILNYKSFSDSGEQSLETGFNIIVGQNNAGKTALSEALSLRFQSFPHRSIKHKVGVPLNPHSRIVFSFSLTGDEARDVLMASGLLELPIRREMESQAQNILNELLSRPEIKVSLDYSPTGGGRPVGYPSHQAFQTNDDVYARFGPDPELQSLRYQGAGSGKNDNFSHLMFGGLLNRVYCFRAERFNLGSTLFADQTELLPNNSNLAAVLNNLQGRNPARFDLINRHISAIFPTVKHIGVRAIDTRVEIIVWNVDPATEREDLAIPLSECGTGISQVLAMLYVVVTSNWPRTIIIDEPNAFLHPGALRKLLGILREASQPHQYILTTHSPETIAITDPTIVYLVRWQQGESRLENLPRANIRELRRALDEVGARLSDVFSADAIVWVEGPTEQECFPKILQKSGLKLALGTLFVALRNTGDLESRRPSARALWEIYERLSTADALMPRTLAFTLDRENRRDGEIEELVRRSRGLVHFLPRRNYESYLLDPEAIAVALSSASGPIDSGRVVKWISEHGKEPQYAGSGEIESMEWYGTVDGAKLLANLFLDLTNARTEFRKMVHSVSITDWLLAHKPSQFEEIVGFLRTLIS